jgi:small redox-active disulfide protein 2
MRKLQILGAGCPKCKLLMANAEAAVKALGIDATVEKVEKIADIIKFGVMMTPAFVVDGQVKSAGKVLSAEDIKKLLNEPKPCACAGAPKLIFACSGAADVGAVADQAARTLSKDGAGKMYCLAGIGGRVSGIMATTQSAARILAIDGCPLNCVKNTLELAGFKKYEHLQVADLGMEKGKTPPVPETIAKVAAAGSAMLAC